MSNSNRKGISNHLMNLMSHIIKWETQEKKRGHSWVRTINNSRDHIEKLQKKQPSLNDDFLNENWNKTTEKAIKKAESEIQQPVTKRELSWNEVFVNKYTLTVITILLLLSIFIYF